jgi:SnoaL-like protein
MQPKPRLSPALPAPLARYFESETPEAVAHCFTDEAAVVDEGHEHRGRAAIAAWNAASNAKYSFATEPLGLSSAGGVFTVTAKVTGTFPGSPVQLRFGFTIEDGLIARLEIAP